MRADPTLTLRTSWCAAADGRPAGYALELENAGAVPMEDFTLCVSGPARIDPRAQLDNGRLIRQLANHAEIAPPEGFVLSPGDTWRVGVDRLGYPLRHWNEGANSAYVVRAGGRIEMVKTIPTAAAGVEELPRRGSVLPHLSAGSDVEPLSIIPWPNAISIESYRQAPAGLMPHGANAAAQSAITAFARLTADLFPAEGVVRQSAEGGAPVALEHRGDMGPEAYELVFAGDDIRLHATGHVGFLFGLVTLGQIWRGAQRSPRVFSFPEHGRITDAPGLGWRGAHLDVARHFYGSAEIAQLLKIMAWNKLNRFHWHLTDDEGWRIEIDAYPELATIAAWRGHDLPVPPLLGSGPEPTGGVYSKAAIRDLVALGESLGIVLVPEIDVPGHSFATLAALPWLRDPGETGEYLSVQGFPNNCLNPARQETYRFLDTVLAEVLELFPARIIHIGADEVPLAAWSGSPQALAMIERLCGREAAAGHATLRNRRGEGHSADHIEGSAAAALQAELVAHVQDFLRGHGAMLGGWEEAGHGDVIDKSASYLVGWRNVQVNALLASRGYRIVASPGQRYYLDMAIGPDWAEPGASWAGSPDLAATYGFEAREGWNADQLIRLLGVQASIWSEPMHDRAIFDRLVFPRLSAVAEAGWTEPENKSFARFSSRVALLPVLYGY